MIIKELNGINEMLEHIEILQHMYPNLTLEDYSNRLAEMVPYRYSQIGVFDQDTCVAISGFWLHTKVWIGRILELDNVIVDPAYQGKGIGKMLQNYLEKKAVENKCKAMALDAFVHNFKAHRFYYNEGYVAKGFHFVKSLDSTLKFI